MLSPVAYSSHEAINKLASRGTYRSNAECDSATCCNISSLVIHGNLDVGQRPSLHVHSDQCTDITPARTAYLINSTERWTNEATTQAGSPFGSSASSTLTPVVIRKNS